LKGLRRNIASDEEIRAGRNKNPDSGRRYAGAPDRQGAEKLSAVLQHLPKATI